LLQRICVSIQINVVVMLKYPKPSANLERRSENQLKKLKEEAE